MWANAWLIPALPLLGVERGEQARDRYRWIKPLAAVLILALLGEGLYIALSGCVGTACNSATTSAPALQAEQVGDPVALSETLFQHYLLPFEVTSVLLLVAIIGAVVLTRRQRQEVR